MHEKKMTKLLALALAATFALTACNTGGETTEPAPSEGGETAETTTSEGEGTAEATSETAEHEPITDLYRYQRDGNLQYALFPEPEGIRCPV